MDHSHSTDQAESASSTDHLAVQTKEGATKEANNTVSIGGMELDVFRAAKQGDLDALREHAEHLDLKLTATNNTFLLVYIACLSRPTSGQNTLESAGIVKDILEMCPALLWQHNKSGETALHLAARQGLIEVGVLIDQATKVRHHGDLEQGRLLTEEEACLQKQMLIRKTNNNKNTALHEAVRFNQCFVVEKLTIEDPEFSYAANDSGETPIYLAAERGYLPLVSKMLKNCSVPTYTGPNGRRALHAAVIQMDKEMTEELLKADRTLSKAADELGCTPLHLAARIGSVSIVKQLLANDRSTAYIADKDGATALHFAASEGNLDELYGKILRATGVRPSPGTQRNKVMGESLQKAKETHLVVATLIATVTFAAGFTMPGGYQSEKGPDQGSPLLSRTQRSKHLF
ncbi:hypothetical protein ACFX2B_017994 [Malus domestica]